MLVNYLLANSSQPVANKTLFNYIFGGNGVFLQAVKPGISLLLPISNCEIRGLPQLDPHFHWTYPKIPGSFVEAMLHQSQAIGTSEILFYLRYEDSQWILDCPDQETSSHHCRPLQDDSHSAYAHSLVNIHSHHIMQTRFSQDDNAEDQGFRIYGVLGNLADAATLLLRVGVYGYFWEIPASWVFELPQTLTCGATVTWIHD
ncbi:hypothetical protein ACQ4M3_24305 [Leptolyngbya sp. AN03gr2]|uniref:hypothetical protein n=1 Tax=unclassified Leptolyngbya TaxID=2650499 RepID=UPI003D31D5A5